MAVHWTAGYHHFIGSIPSLQDLGKDPESYQRKSAVIKGNVTVENGDS